MMKKFWTIFLICPMMAVIASCGDVIDDPEPDEGGEEQIEPTPVGPDFVSEFRKHVALWEFTGAWCANCPSGYTNMNFILTANSQYSDTVHPMAFHSNNEAEDDLAISATDQIMVDMNLVALGFPSYLVDMNYGGSLVEGVMLKEHLQEVFDESPCCCGVAVSSETDAGKASVEIKLYSEVNAAWRVAVYVVEDKVKYYQKDGMREHKDYTHRHVVRSIASSSYKGDRIGGQVTPAGTELTETYEISVSEAWNPDNTYVYVLALDSHGHVNNMNFCSIDGGKSDYDKI